MGLLTEVPGGLPRPRSASTPSFSMLAVKTGRQRNKSEVMTREKDNQKDNWGSNPLGSPVKLNTHGASQEISRWQQHSTWSSVTRNQASRVQ